MDMGTDTGTAITMMTTILKCSKSENWIPAVETLNVVI